MESYSEQTKAIIDRLTAEGQLLRNTGTNSIRSVRIELEKFQDVFKSVSSSIAEQSKFMERSVELNEQNLFIQKEQSDSMKKMNELSEESVRQQKEKSDLKDLEVQQRTQDTQMPASKEQKKSLIGMGTSFIDSVMKFVSGFAGAGFKLLLGAGGLFAAYNFIKGYVDEKTGGGFTKFEESLINLVSNVDWDKVATEFMNFATQVPVALGKIIEFLSDPLKVLLGAAGVAAVIAAVNRALSAPMSITAPGGVPGAPGQPGKTGRGLGPRATGALRGAGLLGLGLTAYDLYDTATNENLTQNEKTIGYTRAGAAVTGAATGAAIGSVVPVVGTTIGGIVGGLLGAYAGENLGEGMVNAKRDNQVAQLREYYNIIDTIEQKLKAGKPITGADGAKLGLLQREIASNFSQMMSDGKIDRDEALILKQYEPIIAKLNALRQKHAAEGGNTKLFDATFKPVLDIGKQYYGDLPPTLQKSESALRGGSMNTRIDQVSAAGGAGGPGVNVNNMNNVAPNINNVTQGGSTVNNTTVISSGGGSANPFPGIPSALN